MTTLKIIEIVACSIVLVALAVSMFFGSVKDNSHVRYRDNN
jgi:nitrogen fixation-related uncharacterized protein